MANKTAQHDDDKTGLFHVPKRPRELLVSCIGARRVVWALTGLLGQERQQPEPVLKGVRPCLCGCTGVAGHLVTDGLVFGNAGGPPAGGGFLSSQTSVSGADRGRHRTCWPLGGAHWHLSHRINLSDAFDVASSLGARQPMAVTFVVTHFLSCQEAPRPCDPGRRRERENLPSSGQLALGQDAAIYCKCLQSRGDGKHR